MKNNVSRNSVVAVFVSSKCCLFSLYNMPLVYAKILFVNVTFVFPDMEINGSVDCALLMTKFVKSIAVVVSVDGSGIEAIVGVGACNKRLLCVGELKHFFLGYPYRLYFLRHFERLAEGCFV